MTMHMEVTGMTTSQKTTIMMRKRTTSMRPMQDTTMTVTPGYQTVTTTEVIADTLSKCDPANETRYEEGKEAYLKELEALHEGFLEVSKNRRRNMIVVGDKFPFRYLAEEYGFESVDKMKESAGENVVNESLLTNLVLKFVSDNAVAE